METRIMLFDEPARGSSAIADYLAAQGYALERTAEPQRVMARVGAGPVRLVLLERRPATRLGLDMLRALRAVSAVPIIVRTDEEDSEADRITALEAGADDYLPRGTSPRELLARIRTVLRRASPPRPAGLSLATRDYYGADGRPRRLTAAEFELLRLLDQARGRPVSRETIFQAVFRRPHYPDDRAADNLAARLRARLGPAIDGGPAIKPVRGVGYVFVGWAALGASEPQAVSNFVLQP